MYRYLKKNKILFCALIPKVLEDEINFEKYKKARGLYIEDPWERLKSIFSKDDYGNLHPELLQAIKMTQYGAVTGILFGAFIDSKGKTYNFFRTNDANMYTSKIDAYKVLNSQIMLAAVKGSFKWLPFFALFFGAFSFISSCSELYRNKPSILDNIIAGTSVGALFRFMYGIKGMIAGGAFGFVIGTVYGGFLWAVTKVTNEDYLELKYAQFAYSKYREHLKMVARTSKNKEDETVLQSGLHTKHISNPLHELENQKEEEKIVNKKTINK